MYYFTHLVITECISNFKQCNTFVYNIINIFLGGVGVGRKCLCVDERTKDGIREK